VFTISRCYTLPRPSGGKTFNEDFGGLAAKIFKNRKRPRGFVRHSKAVKIGHQVDSGFDNNMDML
jgi:hypothetical protein